MKLCVNKIEFESLRKLLRQSINILICHEYDFCVNCPGLDVYFTLFRKKNSQLYFYKEEEKEELDYFIISL